MNYVTRKIGLTQVLWFPETNRYLMLEEPAYAIWVLNKGGLPLRTIANWCTQKYRLPFEKALSFTQDVIERANQQQVEKSPPAKHDNVSYTIPSTFYSEKCYTLNGQKFRICFSGKSLEEAIHPLFIHAETEGSHDAYLYQIFKHGKNYFIRSGDTLLGSWPEKNLNEAVGKLLMNVVKQITRTGDNDWAAVFHASAVGDDNKCILFPAQSGKGKSTLAAILMKHGFNVLGDDFIPVFANGFTVYSLPVSLSLKATALETVLTYYPDVKEDSGFSVSDKGYRLRTQQNKRNQGMFYPVKALVFVNYSKTTQFKFNTIPQEYALKKLIPETWLSDSPQNVDLFLSWISKIPCYEMTYSDNNQMIKTVVKLLASDE